MAESPREGPRSHFFIWHGVPGFAEQYTWYFVPVKKNGMDP